MIEKKSCTCMHKEYETDERECCLSKETVAIIRRKPGTEEIFIQLKTVLSSLKILTTILGCKQLQIDYIKFGTKTQMHDS
jgi:hypothetical protein